MEIEVCTGKYAFYQRMVRSRSCTDAYTHNVHTVYTECSVISLHLGFFLNEVCSVFLGDQQQYRRKN